MKHFNILTLLISLVLLISPSIGFGAGQGARLQFTKESENLGRILAVEPVLIQLPIEFVNSGDQPLVVTNVRGCCGTRIHEFTKNPVLPGHKGTILIELRLAPGTYAIERVVSVLSNDPEGMKVFHVFGDVVAN